MLRSLALFILSSVIFACSLNQPKQYMVIMDAGSTGTRVYVYSTDKNSSGQLPIVMKLGSCKDPDPNCKQTQNPDTGIAIIDPSSQTAMDSYLAPLIAYARTLIPVNSVSETPINLRATAGVRNLSPVDKQIHLMSLASNTLSVSGFSKTSGAQVLSGFQEGVSQWLNVNSILGLLGQSAQNTVGIIEMGGASEQIVFTPDTQANSFPISILGQAYSVYSYSYNHLGSNEASSIALQGNACLSSSNNYSGCQQTWATYLNNNAACEPLCGLEGINQPPIPQNMIFRMVGGTPTGIAQACQLTSISPNIIDSIGNQVCSSASPAPCPSFKGTPDRLCKLLGLLSTEISGTGSFAGFGFSKNTTKILPADSDGNINGQEVTWTKGYVLARLFGIVF